MKKNRKQENHDTKPDPANQCVVCGAEMPEGDQVCTRCRERTAFNRNASQTIDDRIRELEAEIRMLRGVKKAMGGRDMSDTRYPTRMHEVLEAERDEMGRDDTTTVTRDVCYDHGEITNYGAYRCDKCGAKQLDRYPHCPGCGRRIERRSNDLRKCKKNDGKRADGI